MAGVQTLIMSLWQVDDRATQLLMTEFYNDWINIKQSKRDAFKKSSTNRP
jgi:CHAT domain-containing protein